MPRFRSRSTAVYPTLVLVALLGVFSPAEARAFRVTTSADTVDADPGDGRCRDSDGECSLRAAVQEINARGRGVIRLTRGVRHTLSLAGSGEDGAASGDLDVTGRVKLRGRGATIDAAGLDRIFDVQVGGMLVLKRTVLTGGTAPDGESGGAVRNAGAFDARRSEFSGNQAPGAGGAGGALFNDGGSLRVKRSLVASNLASEAGGGLAADGGQSVIDGSTFRENESQLDGGGAHLVGSGELWVVRGLVDGNRAARSGGGIWVGSQSDLVLTFSTLEENEAAGAGADQGGGGLYNEGDAFLSRSDVFDNLASGASGAGGGVLQAGGEVFLIETVVAQNGSGGAGGGVEVAAGFAGLGTVWLGDNDAGGDGGGLRVGAGAEGLLENVLVAENQAGGAGGGLWCSQTGTLGVFVSDIVANGAPDGPDVFNEPPGGDFSIDGDPVPPG